MILTFFELWMAVDKVAISACPLLSKFDPGMPVAKLQKLLLPFGGQMQRLLNVERYLNDRRVNSTERTGLLFFTRDQGFANRYFNNSNFHQELRTEIEIAATTERQKKSQELLARRAKYADLGNEHHSRDHTYIDKIIDYSCNSPESQVNPRNHRCTSCQPVTEKEHDPQTCLKCKYGQLRDRLSIEVHEWPLPSNDAEAKTVIFGLAVPIWFSHRRDSRLELLGNVLRGERYVIKPPQTYLLSLNDPHLTKQYFQNRSLDQRVTLLSQVKPFVITHYSAKLIGGLVDSDVYVENALEYWYHDKWSRTDVDGFTYPEVWDCTYWLSNAALRQYIFRPKSAPDGPEPNTVIASQSDCPDEVALKEYKELATLPLGRYIQWPNILLQLAIPSVDFKKPETTLAFLQCIYQAGPAMGLSVLREAHDFFSHGENTSQLIR